MEICTTWSLRCGEDIPPCITANHLSEEPEAEVQVEESHPFPHSPHLAVKADSIQKLNDHRE